MFHVIVADAKTVRVFESEAENRGLGELAVFHNPDAKAHERDLVADRPGRIASSANKARQAYAPKASARQYALAAMAETHRCATTVVACGSTQ